MNKGRRDNEREREKERERESESNKGQTKDRDAASTASLSPPSYLTENTQCESEMKEGSKQGRKEERNKGRKEAERDRDRERGIYRATGRETQREGQRERESKCDACATHRLAHFLQMIAVISRAHHLQHVTSNSVTRPDHVTQNIWRAVLNPPPPQNTHIYCVEFARVQEASR